jgi:hypothetical protein
MLSRYYWSGVAVLAGFMAAPGTIANSDVPVHQGPSIAEIRLSDPRLARIQEFFDARSAPAARIASQFLRVSDQHRLDWRLLPSLAMVESEGGLTAQSNNLFGWECGRARFESMEAAVHTVGSRLAKSPLYRNKSLDAQLTTFNPVGQYAEAVKRMMHRLSPKRDL